MKIRNRAHLFFGLACCLLLTACINGVGTRAEKKEEYFNAVIPKGFEIAKTPSMMDFDVYVVSKRGVPFVGVYVGNAPESKVGSEFRTGDVKTIISSGSTNTSVWKGNQLVYREVLFDLKTPEGWPAYVQGWTFKLPENQISIADRILASIVVHGKATLRGANP